MPIPEPIETFMLRLGFDYSVIRPGSSSADEDEGRARSEWVETTVYMADETPILAVVAAKDRVDPHRLRESAAVSGVRLATAEEIARIHPESEPGAVPPLGPLYGQRVFVDQAVTHHDHVVFNAGSRSDAIRMRYGDFAELVHPIVGRFAVPTRS
jgi:Ala-tRNA(Pro) deacylase